MFDVLAHAGHRCAVAVDGVANEHSWVVPVCVQQGIGFAEGARRAWGEEATLRWAQTLKDLEQAYANFPARRAVGVDMGIARVQNIHSRIGNARRDYLHKATTTISQNYAMFCIEDLQVQDMSRSAAGTAQQPGRHVRDKSGLNKSILDQGWGEFRRRRNLQPSGRGGCQFALMAVQLAVKVEGRPVLASVEPSRNEVSELRLKPAQMSVSMAVPCSPVHCAISAAVSQRSWRTTKL